MAAIFVSSSAPVLVSPMVSQFRWGVRITLIRMETTTTTTPMTMGITPTRMQNIL
jgi:hypothetical protein